MKRSMSGFSLVELMVVVAVLVLATSLVLAASGQVGVAARRAECAVNLKGLATAYLAYAVNEGLRFPPLVGADEFDFEKGKLAPWLPSQLNYLVVYKGRFDQGFGPLVFHGYVRDADMLACPAVKEGWWHAKAEAKGKLWHSKGSNPDPTKFLKDVLARREIGEVTTRAAYSIRAGMFGQRAEALEPEGVRAIMADNLSVPSQVLGRHGQGVNVACLDGTVEYRDDEILWNNELDGEYHNRCNQALMMKLWRELDKPRP